MVPLISQNIQPTHTQVRTVVIFKKHYPRVPLLTCMQHDDGWRGDADYVEFHNRVYGCLGVMHPCEGPTLKTPLFSINVELSPPTSNPGIQTLF